MPAGAFGESVADLILRIIADASQYEEELKRADKALSKSVSEGEERIKQYAEEAESSLKKVIRRMHDMDVAVQSFTKRLDSAGWSSLKVAAIMAGPFIAALIKVRETNQEVALQFSKINDATVAIADTMADVAIPYVTAFANWMEKLGQKVQSISPFLKNLIGKLVVFRAILSGVKAGLIFLFSAFVKIIWAVTKFGMTVVSVNLIAWFLRTGTGALILKGLFIALTFVVVKLGFAIGYMLGFFFRLPFLIAKMIVLTAAFIPKLILLGKVLVVNIVLGLKAALAGVLGFLAGLGPLGIAIGILAILVATFAAAWIANWGKIREYTETALNWLSDALNTAIDFWVKQLNNFKVWAYETFLFWKYILKGPWEALRLAAEEAEKFREKLATNFKASELDLAEFVGKVAVSVDSLKAKIKGLWAAMFAGDPNKQWREISAGFQNGLREMLKRYTDWGEFAKQKAIEIATQINQSFSNFFFDAFMGQLDTIQEYFAEFGRFMLRVIADIIAQLLVALMIRQMLSLWPKGDVPMSSSAVSVHEGGLIPIAHEGMSPGERMIRAQVGEGILSRNGMATLGSVDKLDKINAGESTGGLVVNLVQVIKAWDSQDVFRNKKAFSAAMVEELERNSLFRKALKRFG